MRDGIGHLAALVALAWQGVRRRPLSSALTALAVALGVALVVLVDSLERSTQRSYREAARGWDLILAPPHGSPMTAVLATLFHVGEPGGTLAWRVYEEAQHDPRVQAAVPYAMGDNFEGFRVIGTTPELFSVLQDAAGRSIGDGLLGRTFRPEAFEAVVGSVVARATGRGLGEDLQVRHGLVGPGHAHGERWAVVGVLRPTGTPHDRAVYIPIRTFYAIEGHDADAPGSHADEHPGESGDEHDDHASDPAEPRALSAVGIRLKSPQLRLGYFQEFRTTRTDAQAVLPTDQVRRLLDIVGDVDRAFRVVAWLVTVVAAIGILVGLYNTIQGRRREIAVLRALGARRHHVFSVLLLEAVFLAVAGGAAGLLLGHGLLAALGPQLLASYGIQVDPGLGAADGRILLGLLGLGVLAGVLPAWRGLTTPVADHLHPEV